MNSEQILLIDAMEKFENGINDICDHISHTIDLAKKVKANDSADILKTIDNDFLKKGKATHLSPR